MNSLPSFADALAIVLAEARALPKPACERISLTDALDRVLREDLFADRDQPPFDRATRDGFAVRAIDDALPRRIAGSLAAGETWAGDALGPAEAIEIMTGAPVPAGADAVVMVEHTQVLAGHLQISAERLPIAGANIVPRGAECSAGKRILGAGVRVGAAEIAVAASASYATLPGVCASARCDHCDW